MTSPKAPRGCDARGPKAVTSRVDSAEYGATAAKSQVETGREISVYNGRIFCGTITGAGEHWIARDANGAVIGEFVRERDSADAVLKAARGAA